MKPIILIFVVLVLIALAAVIEPSIEGFVLPSVFVLLSVQFVLLRNLQQSEK